MELKVTRVYSTDIPEQKDAFRKKLIYLDNIIDIEETLHNKKYTTLAMSNGIEIIINEDMKGFTKRLDDYMKGSTPGFKTS